MHCIVLYAYHDLSMGLKTIYTNQVIGQTFLKITKKKCSLTVMDESTILVVTYLDVKQPNLFVQYIQE